MHSHLGQYEFKQKTCNGLPCLIGIPHSEFEITRKMSLGSINLRPSSHSPLSLLRDTYGVICIGSGWAANTVSGRVVKAGMTALIVESEFLEETVPFGLSFHQKRC